MEEYNFRYAQVASCFSVFVVLTVILTLPFGFTKIDLNLPVDFFSYHQNKNLENPYAVLIHLGIGF